MMLSGKLYDFVKTLVQVVLPGLGAFYFTIAQIWDLMYAEPVTGTIAALALFLGGILKVSSTTYNAQPVPYDGEFELVRDPDGDSDNLHFRSVDPRAVETKDVLIFKVTRPKVERVQ